MSTPNRQRRSMSFNPNQEFITDAVADFIKQGGEIKRLDTEKSKTKDKLNDNWLDAVDHSEVDDFLND